MTEDVKIMTYFLGGSTDYAGTTQKWTAAVLLSFSVTTLKDVGEGKSFTVGRISGNTHGITFFLEEEMAKMFNCVLPWTVANGLAGWSGSWRKHSRKIAEKDIWGRSM